MPGACDSKATNNRCRRGSRQPPGPLTIAGPGFWCTQRTSMTPAPKISSPASPAGLPLFRESSRQAASPPSSPFPSPGSTSGFSRPPRSPRTGNGPAGHPAAGPGRSPPAPSRRPGRRRLRRRAPLVTQVVSQIPLEIGQRVTHPPALRPRSHRRHEPDLWQPSQNRDAPRADGRLPVVVSLVRLPLRRFLMLGPPAGDSRPRIRYLQLGINAVSGSGRAMWSGAGGPFPCESGYMRKYVIMGIQGSGKGTHAKMLAGDFDLEHIAVGDIFRWNVQHHTKLGAQVRRTMAAGLLVGDDLVEGVVQATAPRARLELRLHHRRLPAQRAAGGVLPGKL